MRGGGWRALVAALALAQPGSGALSAALVQGFEFQRAGRLDEARKAYQWALAADEDDADAWHLLGVLEAEEGRSEDAAQCLERATVLRPESGEFWANLGEVRRRAGNVTAALGALRAGVKLDPRSAQLRYNFAVTLEQSGLRDEAVAELQAVLARDPRHPRALARLTALFDEQERPDLSVQVLEAAVRHSGPSAVEDGRVEWCAVYFTLGVAYHRQSALGEAERAYQEAIACAESSTEDPRQRERIAPVVADAWSNLGACMQAKGRFVEAIAMYDAALAVRPGASGTAGNRATCLWHLGHRAEAEAALEAMVASGRTDFGWEPYVNLGTARYERGDLAGAAESYARAGELAPSQALAMQVRVAMMSRPVMPGCASARACHRMLREPISAALQKLLDRARASPSEVHVRNPLLQVERLPFYWVYHGGNEFGHQALVRELYEVAAQPFLRAEDATPEDRATVSKPLAPRQGAFRIGFLSKFWHDDHPHGKLMTGVLRHLAKPERGHRVLVLALPNPRGGPSDEVRGALASADDVVELGDSFHRLRSAIVALKLDLLVFVDTMSEPSSYFLTYFRMAPVQAAFWGNPLTVGTPHVDFFLSGDWMEPDCAAIGCGPLAGPHYHEQLVRLPGTGIHYDLPVLRPGLREGVQLRASRCDPGREIVFALLQNAFKLHPALDEVVARILFQVPTASVLLLEARQERWTEHLRDRMSAAMTRNGVSASRLRFIPRVATGEAYLELLAETDIVLHPFPFGGSKTSADALALGLPIVALRSAFLRGRMLFAMLRRAGLERFAVGTADEYVKLAVLLASDCAARREAARLVSERGQAVFGDVQVLDGWAAWAERAIGAARLESQFDADTVRLGELVRVANSAGRLEDAREAAEALVAMRPQDPLALNDLGAILHQLGRHSDALEAFERAAQVAAVPTADLHNNMGVVLDMLKEPERAEYHFRRAISLAPRWSNPVYNLANLLRAHSRPYEAFDACMAYLGLDQLPVDQQLDALVLASLEMPDAAATQGQLRTAFPEELVRALAGASVPMGRSVRNNAVKLIDIGEEDLRGAPYRAARALGRRAEPDEGYHAAAGTVLITQLFEPRGAARRRELTDALARNANNAAVSRVVLLSETEIDLAGWLPPDAPWRKKVEQVVVGKRLTFAEAFQVADARFPGRLCVVTNADIFFDLTLERLPALLRPGPSERRVLLALSRWEWRGEAWRWSPRSDSQDAWLFRAPLEAPTHLLDFELGRPRCDNRLAQVLVESGGIEVRNPSLDLRAYHLHSSSEREPAREVAGEGLFVAPQLPTFDDADQ